MDNLIHEDYERAWAQDMNWLGVEKEWEERKIWDEIKEELGWVVREHQVRKRIRILNTGAYVHGRSSNRRANKRAK